MNCFKINFLDGSKPLEPTAVMNSPGRSDSVRVAHPYSVWFCPPHRSLMGKNLNVKITPGSCEITGREREGVLSPGQQEIHTSLYPFHYSLYLYNTEAKAAVGVGFSALVLSNGSGRKFFRIQGLVPVKFHIGLFSYKRSEMIMKAYPFGNNGSCIRRHHDSHRSNRLIRRKT